MQAHTPLPGTKPSPAREIRRSFAGVEGLAVLIIRDRTGYVVGSYPNALQKRIAEAKQTEFFDSRINARMHILPLFPSPCLHLGDCLPEAML